MGACSIAIPLGRSTGHVGYVNVVADRHARFRAQRGPWCVAAPSPSRPRRV